MRCQKFHESLEDFWQSIWDLKHGLWKLANEFAIFFPPGLKRYKILSLIGDGTYGLVYLATNVETSEKVAIKSMKRRYHSWDEVTDLREVKSLKKLHHPNVVKLKEVIRENSRLYFIFEYVRGDLLGLMREKPNENFPEFWIRSVIQQVLQASRQL